MHFNGELNSVVCSTGNAQLTVLTFYSVGSYYLRAVFKLGRNQATNPSKGIKAQAL